MRFTPTRVGNTALIQVTAESPARFTPTRVGNTPPVAPVASRATVHPHTRGEYAPCRPSPAAAPPVHPHTRGEYGRGRQSDDMELRFTPTRVGNTYDERSAELAARGSPPHAWGILLAAYRQNAARWFTPTRVGNTARTTSAATAANGSPPHAWGIHVNRVARFWSTSVHPHTRGEYCRSR